MRTKEAQKTMNQRRFRGLKFKSSIIIVICPEVAVSEVNTLSKVDEKAPPEVGTSQVKG